MLGRYKKCRGAKPIHRGSMKLTTCEGKSTAHLRTRFITVRHFAIRANNPNSLWPRGHATYYRGPMLCARDRSGFQTGSQEDAAAGADPRVAGCRGPPANRLSFVEHSPAWFFRDIATQ